MLRQLALIVLALTPPLGFAQIPDSNADLNGDAITNSLDFSVLAGCFSQDPETSTACAVADVDTDSDIDVNDFLFVAARFGQAYPWKLYPLPKFAVGSFPESVALGDLNEDGVLDMAVANSGNGNLSVLLGNGDGSFQEQQRIVVGDRPGSISNGPQSVALGDLNGDDVLDLAVATPESDEVSLLLGNGDGTFQAEQRFAAGFRPVSVALGDLNGDSVLDLTLANQGSFDVSVLLGKGDGTFQAEQRFAAGFGPRSVMLGDVDSDLVLDLVVANSSDVSVLIGNGDGSFQAQQSFPTGGLPLSAILGDVNDDGKLDLAVTNHVIDSAGNVSALLGNGDGSFQAPQSYAVGNSPKSVALGDINSDGVPDLAVANTGSNDVSVLLGNGDGSFQVQQRLAATDAPRSLALGDINGDSTLDLAIANFRSGAVSVLLGDGDGNFQAQQPAATLDFPREIAVGDLNRDNVLDLVVANAVLSSRSGDASVLLGNGDGSFQAPQHFAVGDNPVSVVLGDLNGDRVLDMAVANVGSDDVAVLLGNGDGSFRTAQYFEVGSNPRSLALGDLNGDSSLDLAVANGASDDVSVLLGIGDGSFQTQQRFATGDSPSSAVLGDVNGDSLLDLAVTNSGTDPETGGVSLLVGTGDGNFKAPQRLAAGDRPISVALDDINGDGVLDMAVANERPLDRDESGQVSVLLGNGDGSFQPQLRLAAGASPQLVALGDVNGDSLCDVAVANFNDVSILLGNGDGSFQTAQRFAAGTDLRGLALGDMNGDSMLDLAVTNLFSDVWVLPRNSAGK